MVTPLIVDASVAVKWFVVETHSREASALLKGTYELRVPAHFFSEVANALVTKVRRGLIERAIADQAAVDLRSSSLVVAPVSALLTDAVRLALEFSLSLYDALYVALAIRDGCQCVTADRRLYEATSPAFPESMLFIGDIPPV
jgi:predicted nucleic acid-binding protein